MNAVSSERLSLEVKIGVGALELLPIRAALRIDPSLLQDAKTSEELKTYCCAHTHP